MELGRQKFQQQTRFYYRSSFGDAASILKVQKILAAFLHHYNPSKIHPYLFYSVLNRSPEHLIKEIILVDDYSDNRKYNDYFAPHFSCLFPSTSY